MKLYCLNNKVLFFENYQKHIKTGIIYRNLNIVNKIIRKFIIRFLPKYSYLYYSNDFKNAGVEDEIIIFDSELTIEAANYIKKKNPSLRLIYWFWNHIYDPSIIEKLDPMIEKWSYDIEDCKKYGLNYNTQFYFKDLINIEKHITPIYLFVGKEKGRMNLINKCRCLLEKNNIAAEFIIIKDGVRNRKHLLPYKVISKRIAKNKGIIDILPKLQTGLSLRPLEALFNQKKLITNFKDIKNFDFYCPENIYIIENDNNSYNIKEFDKLPYNKSVNRFINKYDFDNWIKRFSKV